MDAAEQFLLDRVLRRAGCSPDDVRRLHRRCEYSQRVIELEPVFNILSQPDVPYGLINALVKKMNVPKPTIKTWRRLLLRDPAWRPGSGYGKGRRLFTDEEEMQLAATIRRDFIDQKKYCPPLHISRIARRLSARDQIEQEEPESESCDDKSLPPKRRPKAFTHKWRERFLREAGLSIRRPHTRRRSVPNDECFAQFLANLELIFDTYPLDRIVNADETSWKLINNGKVTVAECGAEGVTCEFDGDVKACMSVIAAIDAAGSKPPLWVICRGTTIRCEATLRAQFAGVVRTGRLVITHKENGWTNGKVAVDLIR
jgi:DNA-binding transcriptional MerR regulator